MPTTATTALPDNPESLDRLLALVALHTSNGVVITDVNGRIRWVNHGFETMTGFTAGDVLGRKPGDLLQGPDTDPATVQYMRQKLAAGEGFEVDILNYTRDGQRHWVHINCTPIRKDEGVEPGFLAIQTDISVREQSKHRLRLAASVFDSSHDAIMISDQHNRIVDINPAFTRITGYSKDDVIGQNPRILSSGRQGRTFYDKFWRTLNSEGYWCGEIWNRRKNGDEYPELLSVKRVLLGPTDQVHYVAIFSDLTTLKNQAKEMERIAHYDDLTNLPNRQLLAEKLDSAITHANRTGKPMAVCYLDLDGFKQLNDQLGRAAGDKLLNTVADRLKRVLRDDDTVARVGGDQFVMVLRDVDRDEGVYQRILDTISQPVTNGQQVLKLSACMGVVVFPLGNDDDSHRLLRHADQAMYTAKQEGRNNYRFFDPALDAHRNQRRQQLSEISRGLTNQEFVLLFQPQVRTRDLAVTGFEALIRWQHPTLGLIAPGSFLPFVEGSHMEIALGEWVLKAGITELGRWHAAGEQLTLCVNISAAHLVSPTFAPFLEGLLRQWPRIDPAFLHLEVLESTALDDMQHARQVISRCQRLGVKVALDDFGTGFSSLAYLRALPVDIIKIDQSFIRDLPTNTEDRAIVESILILCSRFQRPVVAEGVETQAHIDVLSELGCDLIQGYAIARPMPGTEVSRWLSAWRTTPIKVQHG
ncbi:MAG: EAL domain-containing protein [Marinobacter sp.]|nr:EAL domain-containing protein [Marinobacter sp.]